MQSMVRGISCKMGGGECTMCCRVRRALLESLSKDVFERRTSTGSEVFSLTMCLDAKKFVLISVFSLIRTIYLRVSTKPPPKTSTSGWRPSLINAVEAPIVQCISCMDTQEPLSPRCSPEKIRSQISCTTYSFTAKSWLWPLCCANTV